MHTDLAYCDFLIFAPLKPEIDALRKAALDRGWREKAFNSALRGPGFPKIFEFEYFDKSPPATLRSVVVVMLTHQGVMKAGVETARVLEIYEAGYVVSFGIAGSLSEEKAPILSVILASKPILYYAPGKDENGGTKNSIDPIPVGDVLLPHFRDLEDQFEFRCVDGVIASGEKVLNDKEGGDATRIMLADRNAWAVEMEAAGVGWAAQQCRKSVEFVVIKGISDYVGRKDKSAQRAAADNAAMVLAALIESAPSRRTFRGLPRPGEERFSEIAEQEASEIIKALAPFKIVVDETQLYSCLYGRRGPIPVYFKWQQFGDNLHWIDFRILCALNRISRNVVTPTLIGMGEEPIGEKPWCRVVERMLNVKVVGPEGIDRDQAALRKFADTGPLGFWREEKIFLETSGEMFRSTSVLVNIFRFMIGQICHRRMFVYSWDQRIGKWSQLSKAIGISFAMFVGGTMTLGSVTVGDGSQERQADGKGEAPGCDLFVEEGGYASVKAWAEGANDNVVDEFLAHFACIDPKLAEPSEASSRADRLERLFRAWDIERTRHEMTVA